MIQYLLLGMLALTVALLVARLYIAADPKQLALWTRRIGGLLSLLTAIWFLLSARYLFAVPFGFIGYVLLSRRTPLGGATRPATSSGRTSSVRTAFIEMLLDHDTGDMRGTVLAGVYAGRDLASLAHAELLVLWRECRAGESQSRQLLEAYLDRRWPEWREEQRRQEQEGAPRGGRQSSRDRTGEGGSPMDEAEALAVLGLVRGAKAEDIRNAHRNLMKRLHPDQGGTTYLAAKINEAKDVLLKSARS